MEKRKTTLQKLGDTSLDVLVLGGGIVGAGIARDAAMRGFNVGLVEQHDFAFGTSSRSSRLLHGGLRYLAQGRVGLVHEASLEKRVIHHIAPHLAQPLPFVFPTYSGDKEWVLWQLKIGVKMYDLMCHGRNFGHSTWLNPRQVSQRIEGLSDRGLTGAVRYYDGFTNDARLVLDTLRSAEKAGAHLLNYCRFQDAASGERWTCQIQDQITGSRHAIEARAVVNATGPWADGLPHSRLKLRLTKGVHLVVDRARLPVPDAVVMGEGKRILFVIPWGERTIIGTTDTDFSGSPDCVTADSDDMAYILEVTNRFFPKAGLRAEDIISTWAGVRPLLANGKGDPSDISRSHEIKSVESGWWDVGGGKLTTYRLMAEQTVDRIRKYLGTESRPCRTAVEPLLEPTEVEGVSGIVPSPFEKRVVEHCCRNEWAEHLTDVMVRRTSWHYYLKDAGERASEVGEWMSRALGWSEARRREELERYRYAPTSPAGETVSRLES
jgi:glycerol-3-phosphate dehydrogenase